MHVSFAMILKRYDQKMLVKLEFHSDRHNFLTLGGKNTRHHIARGNIIHLSRQKNSHPFSRDSIQHIPTLSDSIN